MTNIVIIMKKNVITKRGEVANILVVICFSIEQYFK